MNEPTGQYRCDNCDQLWNFFPEDYESLENWPTICPHCNMPIWEMVKNVYKVDGIIEVLHELKVRYLK